MAIKLHYAISAWILDSIYEYRSGLAAYCCCLQQHREAVPVKYIIAKYKPGFSR
jgi:hypothetical protein